MKKLSFLIIISIILISCGKDDKDDTILIPYIGNDVDSTSRYTIKSNGDTTLQASSSCNFSPDRNTINYKNYFLIANDDELTLFNNKTYSIINNRLILTDTTFPNSSAKYIYTFDHNKFIISNFNTAPDASFIDSTFFHYNFSNQIHQVTSINYANNIDSIYKSKYISTYFWENNNIVKIHSEIFRINRNNNSILNKIDYYTYFEYTDLENPLDYYYKETYEPIPFIRLGKACKNLVSKITTSHTQESTYFYYKLNPSKNSFTLQSKMGSNGQLGSLYEIHY